MAQKGPERQRGPAVVTGPADSRSAGASCASEKPGVRPARGRPWRFFGMDEKASAPRAVARPSACCRCLLRRAYAPCAVVTSGLRRKFPICRASALRVRCPGLWGLRVFQQRSPARGVSSCVFAPGKSTLFSWKKELVVFLHGLDDMPRKLAFCGASLVPRLHEIRSGAGHWPVCARLLERQGGEKLMACFLHNERRRGNPSAPCVFLACRALS